MIVLEVHVIQSDVLFKLNIVLVKPLWNVA